MRTRGQINGKVVLITGAARGIGAGLAKDLAAKAGVEAFANSLRAEVRHFGVGVGVVHPTWIGTDMVAATTRHPVFGALHKAAPGLAGKIYPPSVAVELMAAGIANRSRAVHVLGWVGVVKLFRALVPRIVELSSRRTVPDADTAMLDDIATRGQEESSMIGPGGRAAARSRSGRTAL